MALSIEIGDEDIGWISGHFPSGQKLTLPRIGELCQIDSSSSLKIIKVRDSGPQLSSHLAGALSVTATTSESYRIPAWRPCIGQTRARLRHSWRSTGSPVGDG